jgi:16S rRNA (uracil1498-N3)-methyltransferase
VLIGPEGDFSPGEVEMALSHGYMPVTFGATRLRTETAALYALCAAHTIITQKTPN